MTSRGAHRPFSRRGDGQATSGDTGNHRYRLTVLVIAIFAGPRWLLLSLNPPSQWYCRLAMLNVAT